jgi:guanine deaminase
MNPSLPSAPPAWTVIRGGRLIEPGVAKPRFVDILIEGDTVREIGAPGLVAPQDAVTIDATHKLLHAGLVNAHTHGHGNLARGMGDRWTLELLLTAAPWINGNRSAEDKHLTTLIGAAEMLLKGCTACYDLTIELPLPTLEGMQAAAAAYERVGMRAVLAPMVADIGFYDAIPGLLDAMPAALRREVERMKMAPTDAILAALREVAAHWKAAPDGVRLAIAPTIPHHCSDAFLVGCRDLARDNGLPLHTHVSESKVQAIVGMRTYASTLTAHLDGLGMLGPDFTVAHGVWLDDDDIRMIGERGASIAHNPGSNMRLGSGIARMRKMLAAGVNVGIGTDGSSCSDNQNMYEAMRLASFSSKVQGPDWQTWVTTGEVLHAATVGSAKALGLGDRIGRIAPGFKADIVFLDSRHITMIPLIDATNALVHAEDGGAVHSVMVGGRMVVVDHALVGFDMDKLAVDAENAVDRLEAMNAGHHGLYKRLEPIVGSFCPGLAAEPFHVHRYGSCRHD